MDRTLIFYGAGNHAKENFNTLVNAGHPVCFADRDANKQGTELCGVPVISPDEAQKKYPDANYLISLAPGGLFLEVQDYLINECGIPAERIKNYAPYYYGCGCTNINQALFTYHDNFSFCCRDFGKNLCTRIEYSNSPEESANRFLAERRELAMKLKDGIPNCCSGCSYLQQGYFYENSPISFIHFGYGSICNLHCVYCKTLHLKSDFDETRYDHVLNMINCLRDRGLVTDDTHVHFASGELTVHPYRDKILAAFENNYCEFYTNAVIYNDKIAEILSLKKGIVISSPDAGRAETFERIKGVDAYDKVYENIKQYVEHGIVQLKYIFLKGINDNFGEIDAFVQKVAEVRPASVLISRDAFNMTAFDDDMIDCIVKMHIDVTSLGIPVFLPEYVCVGDDYEKIMSRVREARL